MLRCVAILKKKRLETFHFLFFIMTGMKTQGFFQMNRCVKLASASSGKKAPFGIHRLSDF